MDRHLKATFDKASTRIVATTRDVDRDGEVVDPKGVSNFSDYLGRNPVILWQHRHNEAPVGKATNGSVRDDRIELDVEWAPTPLGQETKALYEGGFMSSFSIGFIPRKSEDRGGQFTWTEWELLEVSAVSIPANPFANVIRSAEKAGLSLPTIKSFTMEDSMDIDPKVKEQVKAELEAETKREAERQELEALRKEKEQREAAKNIGQNRDTFHDDATVKAGGGQHYRGHDLAHAQRAFADRMVKSATAKDMADKPITRDVLKAFVDLVEDAKSMASGGTVRKDMLEGTTTAGGFLTPTVTHELMNYARLNSVALRNANVREMTTDIENVPVENAKVNLNYNNEATEATETSATFTQVQLTAQDLDGYADVSMHLEMDSREPIAAVLLDQFTEAYGQMVDSAVFAGTGDPVSGIFLAYGRSEVFSAGSTSFSEILASNLINAIGKLEKPRRRRARWYGGREALWQHVMTLEDGNNNPYLVRDMGNSASGSILGYPIEETEYAPDDAVSTAMLVFGDLEGMIVGSRLSNLTLFRDPYSLSSYHYVRYVFWTRLAYALALPNNFVGIATPAA